MHCHPNFLQLPLLLQQRTVAIVAHENDVNAVSFLDDSTNVFASGSDDMLCKVWDRRLLRERNPRPVGIMRGHADGITFIDAKVGKRELGCYLSYTPIT